MYPSRSLIAILILADPVAHAGPATVEWTEWFGMGAGIARSDQNDFVSSFRLGIAVDFELTEITNPWHYGGKFDVRCGPWLVAETRLDNHYVQAGLSFDFGQVHHASFGTYTLRGGGGIDIDGHAIASFTFLGGVRYVPARSESHPKVAHTSGGRIFGMVTTNFDGGSSLLIGIEVEPTWMLPPYSLHKLGGVNY